MPLDDASSNTDYLPQIPAAVRRQAERAEELARAQFPSQDGENTTVVEQPTSLDADSTTVVQTPPEPAPAPAPAAPASPDWEQRYRTLQGKYDAEVPQMRGQIMQLTSELESVRRRLEERVEAPPPPAPPQVSISAEDRDTYGEDLIERARAWARAELQADLDTVRQELHDIKATKLRELETQTTQLSTEQRQQRVLNALDADPDIGATWRATNDDPGFTSWCQQVDPLSGISRLQMLRNAFLAGEAARVGAFFKLYSREHTAPAPAQPASHTPDGAARPSLESLAAPGRASGPPDSGATDAKRIWSRPEITAFYNAVAKGQFNGRDADKQRTEQEIHAAIAEGRIR